MTSLRHDRFWSFTRPLAAPCAILLAATFIGCADDVPLEGVGGSPGGAAGTAGQGGAGKSGGGTAGHAGAAGKSGGGGIAGKGGAGNGGGTAGKGGASAGTGGSAGAGASGGGAAGKGGGSAGKGGGGANGAGTGGAGGVTAGSGGVGGAAAGPGGGGTTGLGGAGGGTAGGGTAGLGGAGGGTAGLGGAAGLGGSAGTSGLGGAGGGDAGAAGVAGAGGDAGAAGVAGAGGDAGAAGAAGNAGAAGMAGASGMAGSAGAGLGLGPAPVVLGSAGDFVILAESGISNIPLSAITGNIGLSPNVASGVTGFPLTNAGTAWTTPEVTGFVFAADNDPPTPTNLTTAIGDMMTAYTDAATRPTPMFLDIGAGGSIGGLVLVPGLYRWNSSVTVPDDVVLAGAPDDTWIFQITGDFIVSPAKAIKLSGGAQAKNVVWQVAGLVDFGTTSHAEGIVLTKTAIHLETGASINGRLFAQTAVTLDGATVVQP